MNKKYISIFKKQSYSIALILFSILTSVLIYNSCSTNPENEVLYSKILNRFIQDFDIKINNNDSFTNKLDVSLNLKVPEKDITHQKINFEIKISNKMDCSDGEWEPYSPSKNWSLSLNSEREKEQELSVYVRFRERRYKDINYTYRTEELSEIKGESKCFRTSIIYDRLPPRNLRLDSTPAQRTNQKIARFRFTGEDYGQISFECKLAKNTNPNGNASWQDLEPWHACASSNSLTHSFLTSGSVSYGDSQHHPNLLEDGHYQFSIRAKDSSENTSDPLHYEWEINSEVPSIEFSSSSDSPCFIGNSNEANSLIDSIPIQIHSTHRNPNNSHPFSIYCKDSSDVFRSCGSLDASNPNARLDIPENHFIKTSLTASSEYSNDIIAAYSDTIYYKEYTIEVKATDAYGNSADPTECTWRTLPQNTELVVDNQASQSRKKQADILFIVDHSGSMKQEATALSNSFQGLIHSLSELDWQIAVASMEKQTSSTAPYYFGNFLSIRSLQCTNPSITPTNQYLLSPSTTCSDPIYCENPLQDAFIHTTECPRFSGGSEYGIRAAYKILNQYELAEDKKTRLHQNLSNKEKAHSQFFREDATFVTIFLTDEKNCNNYNNNNCTEDIVPTSPNLCDDFLKQPNSNLSSSDFPDDLIQKVKCLFGDDKKFLAYPIVPTSFVNDEHYIDLAIKTQGIDKNSQTSLNSIIKVDVNDYTTTLPNTQNKGSYTTGLQNISDHIVTITSETIQLPCQPRDEVPASNGQLRIPGPIYSFKPTNGTFIKLTPRQSQTNPSPYTHTFVTTDPNNQETTHYIKILESWKTGGQSAIRAEFTPLASPNPSPSDPFDTIPILPNGTYKVEYSCTSPQNNPSP